MSQPFLNRWQPVMPRENDEPGQCNFFVADITKDQLEWLMPVLVALLAAVPADPGSPPHGPPVIPPGQRP